MNGINAAERSPAIPERRRVKERPPVAWGHCPECGRDYSDAPISGIGPTGHFCEPCQRAF